MDRLEEGTVRRGPGQGRTPEVRRGVRVVPVRTVSGTRERKGSRTFRKEGLSVYGGRE